MKKKKYQVFWEERRYAIVKAKNEEKALELVNEGQFDKDFSDEITLPPEEAIEIKEK